MNTAQQMYADADATIGNLLVQIDTFYQSLPQAVKAAYDRMGERPVKYGCHCDLCEGDSPDGCVFDVGHIDDCVEALSLSIDGKGKFDCDHWKPIALVIK